jgi:Nucleotide modification associated domain 1
MSKYAMSCFVCGREDGSFTKWENKWICIADFKSEAYNRVFAEPEDNDFETNVWEVVGTNVELLLSKHRDYGPKNISQSPGGALNGLRVRMHDKLARINNLIDSGVDPEHESLIDSFIDLANYCVIAQLVIRGEWPNE